MIRLNKIAVIFNRRETKIPDPSSMRLPMPLPAPPGDEVAERVVDPEDEPSESGPRSALVLIWSIILLLTL